VAKISSSNGRAVDFCYDDPNNPTDITGIADNANPTIKQVLYTYDSSQRLSTATQSAFNSNATTTYQYNQGSSAGVGDVTAIIVNDACGGTNCESPLQVHTYLTYGTNALGTVLKSISSQLPGNGYQYSYTIPNGWTSAQSVTVTLPDNATRKFVYDSAGYVTEDERNVGVVGTTAEYTAFQRGQQTIGASNEFIGEVLEQDQNQNTLRETTYKYDNNGNVISTTLSPKPGDSSACCSSSATWTYTYGTFNRLASAVEPLAYNGIGTTYFYDDTPSAPTITVTDPLGRTVIVVDNPQGQPISIQDPMGYTSTTAYNSFGDVQSSTDPAGGTTTYQPDPDGRIKQATSPLNEITIYHYDALDDVTDVYVDPNGLNLHTNYTYDLIGEIESVTTPNGNLTTYSHDASLASVTVKDPRQKTTVTNLDGQGGATDYTDKRGVKTQYTYDPYGRISSVAFNSTGTPGFTPFSITVGINDIDGAYDALDRPENVFLWKGTQYRGPSFSYDSLNDILQESAYDSATGTTYHQVNYQYDANGRRTSLAPTLSGVAMPTINYGYDCADELVAMSNNGTSLQSCGPSSSITNGTTSTQVAFNYDADGNPAWTLVDGVQTFILRDMDERTISQTFKSYPPQLYYGNLSYEYDADGRMVGKYGTLEKSSDPPNDSATYSVTDQLATWTTASQGTVPTTVDEASNLTFDPATGFSYTWDARDQLTSISGGYSETYDALGRRETSSSSSDTMNFLHDGTSLIGFSDSASGLTWSFLPGGLAASLTYAGQTINLVPLIDADGTTVVSGLPGAYGSPYRYDPSGVTNSITGEFAYPFQYQGLEHENTDPAHLYFEPSGNVYDPQIQRELSQVGQEPLFGPPDGGAGLGGVSVEPSSSGANPGASAGTPPSLSTTMKDLETVADAFSLFSQGGPESPISIDPFSLYSLLSNLFNGGGGGSQSSFVRQLQYRRHPLYVKILGVPVEIIITVASAAPVMENGAPSNTPPLQRSDYSGQIIPVQFPDYHYCGPGNDGGTTQPGTTDACCEAHDKCYGPDLSAGNVSIFPPGKGASAAQQKCDAAFCNCLENQTMPSGPYDLTVMAGGIYLFCYARH
jgi:YD repeat-containing protein